MIGVELRKLFRRPRTWVTIAVLNALPVLVAVLVQLTDLAPRPGEGPPFLSAVLTNGALFPLAALAIVLPLFLPIAVAVVPVLLGGGRAAPRRPGRSTAAAARRGRRVAVRGAHPHGAPLARDVLGGEVRPGRGQQHADVEALQRQPAHDVPPQDRVAEQIDERQPVPGGQVGRDR